MQVETETDLVIMARKSMAIYSRATLSIKADGTLGLQGKNTSINGGSSIVASAGTIDLNGPKASNIPTPEVIPMNLMPDVTFDASTGWKAVDKGLASVVNRAPTHEPYPFHNKGVKV
jgi:hypothetical protein